MSLQIFKDILKKVPGLQASVISTNLKSNMNFMLDEHVKDKELYDNEATMFDKFVMICTRDSINLDELYKRVKDDLELTYSQFLYLYNRMKEDVHLKDIVKRLQLALDTPNYESVPGRVRKLVNDNDFMYVAKFLQQECNNAAKFL
ncbi:hypothetical protein [Mocis latipes granulovirus]|uniref:Uncharacterized protein n=1 Tax=Mocis latipes granulovirus TaxID=2072024 RepID=A0A162GW14_9BBAC|nr:hypothetical protein [Mocis latipes granulovirus]AKR17457.2 hypothetical protein [Mocis latipes granulovirus]